MKRRNPGFNETYHGFKSFNSLLEEAAIDGIPAIVIDPKGDIANLALTFPQLRPEDFRPWVDAGEASRKGQSVDEFAAATAATWRKGLEEWGQDGERVQVVLVRHPADEVGIGCARFGLDPGLAVDAGYSVRVGAPLCLQYAPTARRVHRAAQGQSGHGV